MAQPIELAVEYTWRVRNGVGEAYGAPYRKQIVSWWMDGWMGDKMRSSGGPNFEAPLRHAYGAGRVARRERGN